MKKKVISILIMICMLFTLVPAPAMAATTVKLGNISLPNGYCLVTNEDTTTKSGDNGGNYVAYYNNNVLTLNGLNINNGKLNITQSLGATFTIKLADGSQNTVITAGEGAVSAIGTNYGTIDIIGNGTLYAIGQHNGIWTYNGLNIGSSSDNPTVVAQGGEYNGIATYRNGDVVLKNGNVTAIGINKFGIAGDKKNNHKIGDITVKDSSKMMARSISKALEKPAEDASGNEVGTTTESGKYFWYNNTPAAIEDMPRAKVILDGTTYELTNVTSGMKYITKGMTAWETITGDSVSLAGISLEPGDTVAVQKMGANGSYDSNVQVLLIGEENSNNSSTISFEASGGTGNMNTEDVENHSLYTLPECAFNPPANQQFKAWMIGNTEYAPGAVFTVTGDTTVKAVWEDKAVTPAPVYWVTFQPDADTDQEHTVDGISGEYILPDFSELTDLEATPGKVFKGWKIYGGDGTLLKAGDKITVAEPLTLYAVWEDAAPAPVYEISCSASPETKEVEEGYKTANTGFVVDVTNEGNTETGDLTITKTGDVDAFVNSVTTIPSLDTANNKTDGIFVGVKEGLAPGTYSMTITFDNDKVDAKSVTIRVIVKETPAPVYWVTFQPDADTDKEQTVDGISGEYTLPDFSELTKLEATPGKVFKGWKIYGGDGTLLEAGDKITVTESLTLYAVWEDAAPAPTINLEFNKEVITFWATEGYTVSEVSSGVKVTNMSSAPVIVDVSFDNGSMLRAKQDAYTISSNSYETITIAPKEQYTEGIYSDVLTLKVNGEIVKEIPVTFTVRAAVLPPAPATITLTFDANGGSGSMVPVTTTESSYTFALPANTFTKSGYTFTGWDTKADGTGTNYADKAEVTLTEDTTLYAQWKKVSSGSSSGGSYNPTYKVDTADVVTNGAVSSDKTWSAADQKVTITVTPDKGYRLDDLIITDRNGKAIEYTDNGDGTYTFKMPASKVDVRATFEKVPAIILTVNSVVAEVFGETVINDVAPEIKNSRTMLPIRFVAEALGADVEWDAKTRVVTITKDGDTIKIIIGASTAYLNGKAVKLDSAAYIKDSRTYLPVRFVAENLDASVDWDKDTYKVTIIPN